MNVEQEIWNYLDSWVTTKNCVSKTEGQREIIQGFQNLRKNSQTGRSTDRHDVTNCEYENTILLYLSRNVFLISFTHSCTIQQTLSNNRLGMGRNKTPLQLVTIHFRWKFVQWLAYTIQSNLSARIKKEYRYSSTAFLEQLWTDLLWNLSFPRQKSEKQFVANHVMYGTAVVAITVLTADSSGRMVLL